MDTNYHQALYLWWALSIGPGPSPSVALGIGSAAQHQALRLATGPGLGSKLCVAPLNGTAFERYTPLLGDINSSYCLI